MAYKPSTPFNVPLALLVPTYSSAYGVPTKSFPSIANATIFYGNFKTYGGTERNVNGLYSVEDTAIIETWFRPDIKADCRVALADDSGEVYEIVGKPEDIELRHQYLRFKVQRVEAGA